MKQKMKLHYKAALPLALSALLLAVPIAAFPINGGGALAVMAEEIMPGESGGMGTDGTEDGFNGAEDMEEGTDGGTEEDGASGGEPEPECACRKKCTAYAADKECGACAADYKNCRYKMPNVRIDIIRPSGWHKEGSASVSFRASDAAHTGNFEMASMQAKIGQNGSWTDVTEEKSLEISENCTVYARVTDQDGNTYEKNRAIRCFDTTKPTLNAAVSDGLLSIQVHDADSGAKAAYVNGYEFKKLTNGALNIRLQKFDAGYEHFTVYAMDNAGNLSDVYQTKNPYYKDPADESNQNPAERLPASAEPTSPGSAQAAVTEHTKTDSSGNAVSKTPLGQGAAPGGTDAEGSGDSEEAQGREFYTIQSESGKTFYLVIDRNGREEKAYFLTEITENDLLNVTSGNSGTLPKNAAAPASAVRAGEGALPNNNGEYTDIALPKEGTEGMESTEEAGRAEGAQDSENAEEAGRAEGAQGADKAEDADGAENGAAPISGWLLIGIPAAAFIGGAYYFKTARKKKEGFIEDEDEDDGWEEEEEDCGEDESGGDDFFDRETE